MAKLSSSARAIASLLACIATIAVVPAVVGARTYGSNELRFGMSTALTGQSSDLGREMQAGVSAAFARADRNGGIRGRQLTLVSLDDGYEPARTVPNMRTLAADVEVLGVVGNVGTPTAIAAVPIAVREHLPFIGAFTGAGMLRKDPPDRYVFNLRASYAEETTAMVDALVDEADIKPEEIAFFVQRDAYGEAGFVGGMAAMTKKGLKDEAAIVVGTYERNSLAVENGLADILSAPVRPKAIILIGSYAPCAKFIRLAREHGIESLLLSVSFVGVESLEREVGSLGEGVIVTQVVPHPSSGVPIASEYRDDMQRLDPARPISFTSFEGYIVGRLVCSALERVPGEFTRQSLIEALESMGDFDLGLGSKLTLDRDRHQASHRVWPTVIRKGSVEPFDWRELAAPSPHD